MKGKDSIELIVKMGFSDKSLTIQTDRFRVQQILSNLIGNALKFTDEGFIEFGYNYKKIGELLFYVKDTGIGIPSNKLDVIFDRFRQVEETYTRNYEGTGLGLAISKKFTELLGGEMWVESEIGIGTTFYFTLPFSFSGSETIKQPKEFVEDDLKAMKNKNILVVEDEESNFSLIEKMLKVQEVNVIRASDGHQAVDYVDTNYSSIDLILMDIKIPGLNGYEATQVIKGKYPKIPIIAQTAYAINGEKEKCLESGCDDYISKPIDRKELYRKINQFISTNGL
ncbi:MAG: ATP-binding protein [Bacteroidales bacterium]